MTRNDAADVSPDTAVESAATTARRSSGAPGAGRPWPGIAAGLVVGVSLILWSFTLAALVFSGELGPYMARGAGFILAGSGVLCLVMALRSSHPTTIAASDEAAGVIIALIAGAVVADAAHLGNDAHFATVMAAIVTSTLVFAGVCFALGRFGLGNLARFIPHPVIGGVVVTMGWLLVLGAFGVMVDGDPAARGLRQLMLPEVAMQWAPGVLLACILLAAMRRFRHFLVMPATLLGAFAVFYLVVWLLGTSVQELRSSGWLLGEFDGVGLQMFADAELVAQVEWRLIYRALPELAVLILICVLGLLLSATALEVAMKGDIDLNRELRACGLANALAAPFGGIAGSHSLEESLIAREMGAGGRLVGIVAAALCALALFGGSAVLSLLPRSLIGGFILFFGMVLLVEWIYEGWRRLPKVDYAIVVLCLAVSIFQGYLEGIAVGLLAGMLIFVVDYSRISVVRRELSGRSFRSNVERSRPVAELLDRDGDRIYILRLQGYVFFGTGHRIHERVAARCNDETRAPLAFVVLDFAMVSGVDMSAAASFRKLCHLGVRRSFEVVFTGQKRSIVDRLSRAGVVESRDLGLHVFADLDHGLEWCEESLIESTSGESAGAEVLVADLLGGTAPDTDSAATLLSYLELRTFDPGDYLMRQGDPSTDLYLLESGRVAIEVEQPGRRPHRVRSMGPGTVVGEIALYRGEPRSASVVAEVPTRVYRLTRAARDAMKAQNPEVAALFSEYIVTVLASKLSDTTRKLQAVSE